MVLWGLAIPLAALVACRPQPSTPHPLITVDGSSSVYPLTEAVAEDFQRVQPHIRVAVGIAGTGGGLRRLCRGEVAIASASRPMTSLEQDACRAAGVRWVELPVALDAIVVAVPPTNTWVDALTVDELRLLWSRHAEQRVRSWSQVRAGFPDRPIRLFGAGVDSGTFDAFTRAVTGTPGDSRGDYTASEDDNLIVQGVAADPDALGYVGFAYYDAHREKLRAVPIRASIADAPVAPTLESVRTGAYAPLSRPVFLYVDTRGLADVSVHAFVTYYLTHVPEVASDIGFVPLDARAREAALALLANHGRATS